MAKRGIKPLMLSKEDIATFRKMRHDGMSYDKIGDVLGLSQAVAMRIAKDYKIEGPPSLDERDSAQALQMLKGGMTAVDAATEMSKPKSQRVMKKAPQNIRLRNHTLGEIVPGRWKINGIAYDYIERISDGHFLFRHVLGRYSETFTRNQLIEGGAVRYGG